MNKLEQWNFSLERKKTSSWPNSLLWSLSINTFSFLVVHTYSGSFMKLFPSLSLQYSRNEWKLDIPQAYISLLYKEISIKLLAIELKFLIKINFQQWLEKDNGR